MFIVRIEFKDTRLPIEIQEENYDLACSKVKKVFDEYDNVKRVGVREYKCGRFTG